MTMLDETYRFDVKEEDMAEAMILAGGSIHSKFWRKGIVAFVSGLYFLLMVLGGIAFILLLAFLLTGQTPDGLVILVIGGALGGAFGMLWYQALIRFMARDIAAQPFNIGPQEMQITGKGIVLKSDKAEWQTAWSAIHDVKLGKRTLCFCMSGIALYVPIEAIGSRDDAQALLERLQTARKGPSR